MEKQEANSEIPTANDELIWKAHVLDVQRFEGTVAEYCERHGLKLRQLQQYKKKFGVTRTYRPRKSKAFVQVECTKASPVEQESSTRDRAPGLPDPQWVAEVILAIVSRR